MSRPTPLMMPADSEWSNPNGLPRASTCGTDAERWRWETRSRAGQQRGRVPDSRPPSRLLAHPDVLGPPRRWPQRSSRGVHPNHADVPGSIRPHQIRVVGRRYPSRRAEGRDEGHDGGRGGLTAPEAPQHRRKDVVVGDDVTRVVPDDAGPVALGHVDATATGVARQRDVDHVHHRRHVVLVRFDHGQFARRQGGARDGLRRTGVAEDEGWFWRQPGGSPERNSLSPPAVRETSAASRAKAGGTMFAVRASGARRGVSRRARRGATGAGATGAGRPLVDALGACALPRMDETIGSSLEPR